MIAATADSLLTARQWVLAHLAEAADAGHRLGDIGDNPREVEFEPLTPAVPLPITIPAPAEPVRVPEEVPA